MTKYVDIDAVKEAVRGAECDADWDGRRFDAEFIENALDFIPAADVAPVVHGRWIDAPLYGSKNCRCSECRRLISIQASWRGEIMQKYCPNCGAIMDGGDGNVGEEM